ncbi:MAG: hypothetical protein ABI950_07465, partial [Solirubrobacteraceae bacterium]
ARRERAEEALARRSEEREELARRVYTARSSGERVEGRLERTRETADDLRDRIERRERQLGGLHAQAAEDQPDEVGRQRVDSLQAQLEELDAERTVTLERELTALTAERDAAAARVEEIAADADERRAALAHADEAAETARRARKAAEASAEAARRDAAQIGAELAKANQFLRSHAPAPGGAHSLADALDVEPGCELAVAAALGGRLGAAVVEDLGAGCALLDRSGSDGGRALIIGDAPARAATDPPAPGARALADLVDGVGGPELALARRLLADAWLVDDLDALAPGFSGVAVTKTGRAWFARTRELRQAPQGGGERVLEQRNRRDALVTHVDASIRAEQEALAGVEAARAAVGAADATREEADRALRGADRERTQAVEAQRRAAWLIEERTRAPEQGEAAVRRAQVLGELAAEQRVAERAARERAERAGRIQRLTAQLERDRALVPAAERLVSALAVALAAIRSRTEGLEAELSADRAAGEGVAAELRACAAEEARIQTLLRERGETVTVNEVRAQQARDASAETATELHGLAERLGLAPEPASEALGEQEAEALRTRIERLARRREQLGPVNPLAKAEYDEALAHVEELETQRTDLETALRELRTLIRDTDKQIQETFEATFTAAAKNFEELSATLFPGGRGRLRLVREDSGPRPVLGGADAQDADAREEAAAAAEEAEAAAGPEPGEAEGDDLGVEIEITPAGKAMKRLSLLSGGEKSMTAIAFLFAVFLARPCPFYILDEVEAALDDLNIGRFLDLLRAHRDRAQFIVVTHQKRTMEAADTLYGVSMGDDGVSKVVSRHLPRDLVAEAQARRASAA